MEDIGAPEAFFQAADGDHGVGEVSGIRVLEAAEEEFEVIGREVERAGLVEEAAGGGLHQGEALVERGELRGLDDHPDAGAASIHSTAAEGSSKGAWGYQLFWLPLRSARIRG